MKLVKTAIAAGLLAFVMTASAQTYNLRASIPFNFTVGNHVMPAGEYDVRMDTAHARLELYNRDSSVAPIFVPIAAQRTAGPTGQAALTFNTYGRAHFLRTVKSAGTQDGWDLFKSRAERELAKSTVTTTTEVALAR